MTLLAAEIVGGDWKKAIPAACAVEMVHCYSLIHDDLPAMDNDDYRRGQWTNHKKFDEATAILAGDALLTFAMESVAELTPPDLAGRAVWELARAAGPVGMVGGQADDVFFAAQSTPLTAESVANHRSAPEKMEATPALLEAIHRRKTSAMIRVALRLGGLTAGAQGAESDALDAYGEAFGLAFQITDDLLDVLGDAAEVGKRVGKDAEAGKLTFPRFYGIDESRKRAESAIRQAVKSLAVFPESEAKAALRDLAERLLTRKK